MPTTTKGLWPAPGEPVSKGALQRGITGWVRQRTGDAEVYFSYLHQLTTGDMLLLARAMGYQVEKKRQPRRKSAA